MDLFSVSLENRKEKENRTKKGDISDNSGLIVSEIVPAR